VAACESGQTERQVPGRAPASPFVRFHTRPHTALNELLTGARALAGRAAHNGRRLRHADYVDAAVASRLVVCWLMTFASHL